MGVQFAGNILVQSNGGPLPISQGGTGETSAATAINALVPAQTGNTGKVLTTDGSVVSWQTGGGGGGTPAGSDTQIQFNDAGTFGASSNFTINKATGALNAVSSITAASFIGPLTGNASTATSATTVTGAAQTNITSVGTLTALSVSGTITGGTFTGSTTGAHNGTVGATTPNTGAFTTISASTSITLGGLAVGYLEVPQRVTGTTTLVLTDSGKHIYNTTATQVYTIPANASVAFPVGTAITFVNAGSGTSTIAITSDTMYLAGAGTTGTRTLGAYGVATALKITTTSWIISGTSLT